MKILVTGGAGMVARAVATHCTGRGDEVFAYDRQTLDISSEKSVAAVFDRVEPAVVINCAAWTDVDGCESDPGRARAVNALGPELLAANSRRLGAVFVTISTDYVFDGIKSGFYTQRDDPHPASVYGAAKLEGERRALAASARTIVVRTGWIFGVGGRNFLSTALSLARRGQRLTVIRDVYGTPTYAPDLAARLRDLAELDLPGIYHVVNHGDGVSYEEFVRFMLETAGVDQTSVKPVSIEEVTRPAPRPRNSRLYCLLSEAVGLPSLPDWREAARRFVEQTA